MHLHKSFHGVNLSSTAHEHYQETARCDWDRFAKRATTERFDNVVTTIADASPLGAAVTYDLLRKLGNNGIQTAVRLVNGTLVV